ncbi:hypothetical protein KEM60_01398 [Austwickia sp. TVS 96-490-7B]|nr:hypothetical protein [Austwickia sp. TVS 96-490-7B]
MTTLADLESFYHALATGKLLKPETVTMMTTPVDQNGTYGMGLILFKDRCAGADGEEGVMIGHSGGSFGTGSFGMVSRDGTRRISMVMTGRHNPNDLTTFKNFLWEAQRATCTGTTLPNPGATPSKPTGPSVKPTPTVTPSTPRRSQPTTGIPSPSVKPDTAAQLRSKDLSVLEVPDALDESTRAR